MFSEKKGITKIRGSGLEELKLGEWTRGLPFSPSFSAPKRGKQKITKTRGMNSGNG
jgi:hypothetical protein